LRGPPTVLCVFFTVRELFTMVRRCKTSSLRQVGTLCILIPVSAELASAFVASHIQSSRSWFQHSDGSSRLHGKICGCEETVNSEQDQAPSKIRRPHRAMEVLKSTRSAFADSTLFGSLRDPKGNDRNCLHAYSFSPNAMNATISRAKWFATSLAYLLRSWSRFLWRSALIVAMMTMFWLLTPPPALAVSGGRMGGSPTRSSYSPSRSSPSLRRPNFSYSSRPSYYHHYRPRPKIFMGESTTTHYTPSSSLYGTHQPRKRSVTASDIVLLAGATALVANGVRNNLMPSNERDRRNNKSQRGALGLGFSVLSLTVALNVPNRDDPNSVLFKLKQVCQESTTDSRAGVQELVSTTVLELLRQIQSIVSVDWSYKHFHLVRDAQREFNRISMERRSKFDRESGTFWLLMCCRLV
jgi:Protein of unknown function (DUF1517)